MEPGSLIWAKFPGSSWYPALIDALAVQEPGKPLKHEVHFAFPSDSDWGGNALNPKFIQPFAQGFEARAKSALRNEDLLRAVIEALLAYRGKAPNETLSHSILCEELEMDSEFFTTHLQAALSESGWPCESLVAASEEEEEEVGPLETIDLTNDTNDRPSPKRPATSAQTGTGFSAKRARHLESAASDHQSPPRVESASEAPSAASNEDTLESSKEDTQSAATIPSVAPSAEDIATTVAKAAVQAALAKKAARAEKKDSKVTAKARASSKYANQLYVQEVACTEPVKQSQQAAPCMMSTKLVVWRGQLFGRRVMTEWEDVVRCSHDVEEVVMCPHDVEDSSDCLN